MTSEVKIQPQKVYVKDIEWSMEEIKALKELYKGKPFMQFLKREVRTSELIQKALRSEAIVPVSVQKGDTAILHMAKVGFDLVALT